MRFLLDEEQREFARSLDALLTASDTPAGDHGPGRALWSRLAEAGVLALAVPEEYDGLGLLPVELTVAFTELGRHAVPGAQAVTEHQNGIGRGHCVNQSGQRQSEPQQARERPAETDRDSSA